MPQIFYGVNKTLPNLYLQFSMISREEQLKFCKICKNQKFDFQHGVICGLTDKPADFQETCPSFNPDMALKAEMDMKLEQQSVIIRRASQNKRFANHVLDTIFLFVFAFIFTIGVGIVVAIVAPDMLSIFDEDSFLLNYLLTFCAGTIYYTGFEYLTGRTVAKYITRTKVVTDKGGKPDFQSILVRSMCRFIPFEAFSFLGDGAAGWHDTISKTTVIEEE